MAAAPATKAKTTAKAAPAKKAAAPKATKAKTAVGRIARVTGPVVDIEFPHDSIPGIYNALETTVTIGSESTKLVLEVAQHLGDERSLPAPLQSGGFFPIRWALQPWRVSRLPCSGGRT